MTRLRKEKMLRSYLWISERQTNGTIHFHIAINYRMDIKRANRYMRACIFTCIDNNEIKYSRLEAIKYNGVDIAKNRKTKRITNFAKQKNQKNLISYITKYVTKNNEKFKHLAWHSSREYSNLCIGIRLSTNEFENKNIMRLVDETKCLDTAYFTFYRWKANPPPDLLKYLAFINQKILILTESTQN